MTAYSTNKGICFSLMVIALWLPAMSQTLTQEKPYITDTLPFIMHAPDSTSLQLDSKADTLRSALELELEKNKNVDSCYRFFKRHLNDALSLDILQQYFMVFFDSNSEFWKRMRKADYRTLQKKWVSDGLQERNELIRFYYCQFSSHFSGINDNFFFILLGPSLHADHRFERMFNREYCRITPKEKIALNRGCDGDEFIYSIGEMAKKYTLELSYLAFDTCMAPLKFEPILQRTIKRWHSYKQVQIRFDLPGIYRLTIFNEKSLWQRYVVVTALEGIMKLDPQSILVQGHSMVKDFTPPFTIHFHGNSGEYFRALTDSNGMYRAFLKPRDSFTSGRITAILEKDGDIAYITDTVPTIHNNDGLYCYLHTDRPLYMPEQTVHIKAIVKRLVDQRELDDPRVDSIPVSISGMRGPELFSKMLSVDQWGHAQDSFTIPSQTQCGYLRFLDFYKLSCGRDSMRVGGDMINIFQENQANFAVTPYRKRQFELKIQAPERPVGVNDTVRVTITGRYLTGEPLSNASVKLRWYQQDIEPIASKDKNEQVSWTFKAKKSQKLILMDRLLLPSSGISDYFVRGNTRKPFSRLMVTAETEDQSHLKVTAEATIIQSKYPFFLAFYKLPSWSIKRGTVLPIKVAVFDLNGIPYSGSVEITIKKNTRILVQKKVIIEKDGTSGFPYTFSSPGRYSISARIKIDKEWIIQAKGRVNVSRERPHFEEDWTTVTADKDAYCFGDTAILSIESSIDSGQVALSAEGRSLSRYLTQPLTEHGCVFKIPLERDHGYKVYLKCTIFSGSRQITREKQLKVIDTTILLNASIEMPHQVTHGDTVQANITVRDKEGKPKAAQLSVAVVDESVFNYAEGLRYLDRSIKKDWPGAIAQIGAQYPNVNLVSTERDRILLEFITGKKIATTGNRQTGRPADNYGLSVHIRTSNFRLSFLSKKLYDKLILSPIPPYDERSDFRDIGYWNPTVTTNDSGTGGFHFVVPSDLTQWRVFGFGSARGQYLLSLRDSFVSAKPLSVTLQTPPLLFENDTVVLRTVVRNATSSEIHTSSTVSVCNGDSSATVLSDDSRDMVIPSKDAREATCLASAQKKGEPTFRAEVRSEHSGDAEQRQVRVLYNAAHRSVVKSGIIERAGQSDSLSLCASPDYLPGSGRMKIMYEKSHLIQYFRDYDQPFYWPNGNPRKDFSHLLLEAIYYLMRFKTGLDEKFRLDDFTAKEIHQRLKAYRNNEGLWGLKRKGKTDPRITTLAMRILSITAAYDLYPAETVRARELYQEGIAAVRKLIPLLTGNIEALTDLTYSIKDDPKFILQEQTITHLYNSREEMSVPALAQLLECLSFFNKKAEQQAIIAVLEKRAMHGAKTCFWNEIKNDKWYKTSQEVTGLVVRAFAKTDPDNKMLRPALQWIDSVDWGKDFKARAAIMEAIGAYAVSKNELKPTLTVSYELNHGKKETLAISAHKPDDEDNGVIIIPDSVVLPSNTLIISTEGKGVFYYAARFDYKTKNPPRDSLGKSHQFSIERTYSPIKKDRVGLWHNNNREMKDAFKPGDEIEVKLIITSDKKNRSMEVIDYLPAGTEYIVLPYENPAGKVLLGLGAQYNAYDNTVLFYPTTGWNKKTVVRYYIRATNCGTYSIPPARACLWNCLDPCIYSQRDMLHIKNSDRQDLLNVHR
jgi:alpha-2-macroglobulin